MKESVMTFKASCFWRHDFEIPVLPLSSYGTFMYVNTTGKSYKFFVAFNCTTWDFISDLLHESRHLKQKDSGVIQYLIGRVADIEILNDFYQNEKRICPICKCIWVSYNEDKRAGVKDFECLTFNRFENQSHDSKVAEIKRLVSASKYLKGWNTD